MYKIENPLIGADPEFFLHSEDNQPVSAIGLIPGDKHNPVKVENTPGGYMQVDNVMGEYCLQPRPITEEGVEGFIADAKSIVDEMVAIASERAQRPLHAVYVASEMMNMEDLMSDKAQEFGCDPEFCPYTEQVIAIDRTLADPRLRTAGGHIHVGFTQPDKTNKAQRKKAMKTAMKLIKAMDIFLGLFSIVMDPDNRRKQLYGKPGSFRIKSYGIEYRTLSCFWLNSPNYIRWVFKAVQRAIDFVNAESSITTEQEQKLRDIISSGNVEEAKKLITELNNTAKGLEDLEGLYTE